MRVAILGGGQLGRMLGLAAHRLGIAVRFYDEAPDACAGQVGPLTVGRFDDLDHLERFTAAGGGVDAVTYEFENVPVAAAEHLARRFPVHPPAGALRVCQDRLEEKRVFGTRGIETAAFATADTRKEYEAAIDRIGLPCVAKTRRLGYDGKGQAVMRRRADAERAWTVLSGRADRPPPLIVEALVPFRREVSVIAVRGVSGDSAFYPVTENVHEGGILRVSRAPAADASGALQARAEAAATGLLDAMKYVGVLAIEFFEVDARGRAGSGPGVGEAGEVDGAAPHLVANEMAPRVHNSGHWTMDGAQTCQFENHLRAILGLPLGPTAARGHAGMVNLIGACPAASAVLGVDGARLHNYGKTARAGRKVGHVNVAAASALERDARLAVLRALAERAGMPAPE